MYDHKEHQNLVFAATDPDGMTLRVEAPWDAGAEDLAKVFRTIMFWLTWSPAQIDEMIIPVDGWPDLDDIDEPEEKEDEFGNTEG